MSGWFLKATQMPFPHHPRASGERVPMRPVAPICLEFMAFFAKQLRHACLDRNREHGAQLEELLDLDNSNAAALLAVEIRCGRVPGASLDTLNRSGLRHWLLPFAGSHGLCDVNSDGTVLARSRPDIAHLYQVNVLATPYMTRMPAAPTITCSQMPASSSVRSA